MVFRFFVALISALSFFVWSRKPTFPGTKIMRWSLETEIRVLELYNEVKNLGGIWLPPPRLAELLK